MDISGYTALQVIPTLRGFQGNLERQLAAPLVAAGRSAGQATGRGIAQGVDAARAAVERAADALETAREKEQTAAGRVRVAEARLNQLRSSGAASTAQLTRAEEALAEAQRGVARAGRNTQRATQNLADANTELTNATDNATESEGRFRRAVDAMSDKLGPAAKQMLALGAATAGIGTAWGTVSEAISREQSVDLLAAQLGASPELAAEYGRIAGDLYKEGLGESFDDVTQAVRGVQSAFDVLGSEGEVSIDKVTERALNLSKILGIEVADVVQTTSQLVTIGLAKDSTEAFDLMTAASQRVSVAMADELPELINEYGTFFRSIGFDGQEAFGLLVNASDQGKVAMDKVGDALKETGIRATDLGDKGAVEALEDIGLGAANIQNRLLAGGETAKVAFAELVAGLQSIQDPGEQAAAALALIGTPMEDLNKVELSAFLEAMSHAGESMIGFAGSADQAGQTLNDNTDTALKRVTRSIQDELVGALGSGAEWIENNNRAALGLGIALGTLAGALIAAKAAAGGYAIAQGIMAAASGAGTAALAANTLAVGAYTIATGVIRAATAAWAGVQWLLNAALAANPLGLIVVAIGALVAGIVLAWRHSETFRDIVTGAWEAIKTGALFVWDNVLKPFFGWWGDAFDKAGAVAMWLWENAVKPAWDGIKGGISTAWDFIKGLFEDFKAGMGLISDKAGEVKDWIVEKFTALVDFVTGLPAKITDAASGLWDGIKDSFKGAINWLIERWNNFSLGFDFTIPVIDRHISFTIDTPDLPLLSRGGIAGVDNAGRIIGPGSGTSDSILAIGSSGLPTALVSAGEGVVRKSAMDTGGAELVAALNAGWVPPLDLLRAMLPGLASGGLVEAQNWARGEAGKPYQYGGTGDPSWDCSGFVGGVWAILNGKTPNARYFNTESDFNKFGFLEGQGGPNDLSIGVERGGGGPNSHMAMTIGDLNAEASGSDGVEVGPGAQGAADFPLRWHYPLDGDPLDEGSPGTRGGSSGGLGTGGTSGSGTGGSSRSGGGSSLSGNRPVGDAVPVWVDNEISIGNWPSNLGGGSSSSSGSGDSSFTPTDDTGQTFDQAAAVSAAFDKFNASIANAGSDFVTGQRSSIPGIGSHADGIAKTVNNWQILTADVAGAFDRIAREQKRQTVGKG